MNHPDMLNLGAGYDDTRQSGMINAFNLLIHQLEISS